MKLKIKQSVKDQYAEQPTEKELEVTTDEAPRQDDPSVERMLSEMSDEAPIIEEQPSDETKPSISEELTQQPTSDILGRSTIIPETLQEKQQTYEFEQKKKAEYFDSYMSQGESLLFETQEIPNRLAEDEYDRARDEIINKGAERFSFDTSFQELKNISPSTNDVTLKGMVLKDNYDYAYDKIFTGREKQIADLQKKQRHYDKQLRQNPNDVMVIRMAARNKAALSQAQGEEWVPLMDENGQLIDTKWDRPQQKTQQIQQKTEEYKKWDPDALTNLFNELVAKHKYIKSVDDKYIQPEYAELNKGDIGVLSGLAGQSAFSMSTPGTNKAEKKRIKLLEKGRAIEDELEAISHALILNQDPASMKEKWHGYILRGAKSYVEESLGINAFSTKSEMQEAYASAVQQAGGKLTQDQAESLDRSVVDKSLMALGYTIPLIAELAATQTVVKGVTTAASAGKYAKAIKDAVQTKYGKTGVAFLDVITGATQEAAAYALAPSESISAEMGAAENLTQKLLDFKFKGKNVGKLGEFLTRTLGGMSAETVAEFSGDFAKSLKDNDFDTDAALEATFGSTGEEFFDNLLTTAIMTAGFSASSNLASINKIEDTISQQPDSEAKNKAMADIQSMKKDIEQSKTTTDAEETGTTTEEAVQEEGVKQEELQQTDLRDTEEDGMEATEGEEVVDKFESITAGLNVTEDVSDIVGEKSKAGEIDGAKVILDTGKDGNIKLESIEVSEDARGQGFGSKAMDKITDKADELDITLELDAVPKEGSEMSQEDLISFYEDKGFEFEGTKGIRKPTMSLAAESEMSLYDKTDFEKGKEAGTSAERVKSAKKLEKTVTGFKTKIEELKDKAKQGKLQTNEAVRFIKDAVQKLRKYPYKGGELISLTGKVTKAVTRANEAVKYVNAKNRSITNIKNAVSKINEISGKDFNERNTKAAVRKLGNAISGSHLESESLSNVKTDIDAVVTDLQSLESGQEIMYNGQGYTLETIVDGIKNDPRISNLIIDLESDNTIRMEGKKVLFEDVLDEFSQSVDDLYERGVKKVARDSINKIVGKKRSRSIKGKMTATSSDAETIEYFDNVKKVQKGSEEELLNMQLKAQEQIANNYPGTPEYESGVITMKAIEDFGSYDTLDAGELVELQEKLEQIDKEGREALKAQKSKNAAKIEEINEDIENNVDKSYYDVDAKSRAEKEIARSGLTDADASFLERMNAKMKAAKINTAEGIRNFFGKAIMQWSMMAETILSFVDINEKTFGSGKLIQRTVKLVEKARHNYLKGRYGKEFEIMSTYDNIFNDNTVKYNKEGIKESRKRFRKQASKWQLEKFDLPVTIDGKADIIPMTKDQAMRIYAWSKNKALQKELSEQFGLSSGDIEQLKIKLGEKETKFVDFVVDEFMERYYNEINAAYKDLYHINLPKVDSYFPVQRVGMKKETEVAANNPMSSIITATGASMLKNRQKSTARLELNDNKDSGFLSGLFGHINEAEHIIHYGETARDITVALNNPYLKAALDRYGVRDILNKQFREAITQDMGYVGSIPALNKVIDAYTLAALGAKLNMTLKQTTSFVNAMSDYEYGGKFPKFPGVNSAMFMKDAALMIGNPFKARKVFNDLYLSSPIFRERIDSYRQANADLITNASARKPYKKMSPKEAIHSATMSPIKWGDQLGVLYGYGVIYQNELKKGKSKQEAIEAFEQYEKTQQTRSAIHLTGAQINKNAFSRLLTAFKSSSFQYFNQSFGSAHSIYRSLKRDKKIARKDVKRLVVNHALTYALFQMAAGLPKAFKDDDEYWDDVSKESLIGSADGMFFLSAFTEWMYEVGTKTYSHYSEKPSERERLDIRDLRFTLDVERPFNKLIRDLNKEDSDKISTAALFASEILGMPGGTATQVTEGVVDVGDGDFINGIFEILGYTDYVIGKEEPTGRKRIKHQKIKRR